MFGSRTLADAAVEDLFFVSLLENNSLSLAPGQTRPLAFHVSLHHLLAQLFSVKIEYAVDDTYGDRRFSIISLKPKRLSLHEPHKFTFMHSGGIVSYAILKAPSPKVESQRTNLDRLPVFLNLHGAGLEADSDQVRHSLDVLPDLDAWILFPTGVTPWSADDWRRFWSTTVWLILTKIRYMGIR